MTGSSYQVYDVGGTRACSSPCRRVALWEWPGWFGWPRPSQDEGNGLTIYEKAKSNGLLDTEWRRVTEAYYG